MLRHVLLAITLLSLPLLGAPAAAVDDPCRSVLAEDVCDALPQPGGPADETCRSVFADAVCDAARDAGACQAEAPPEACDALGTNPAAPIDVALCDATSRSLSGGCLRWSRLASDDDGQFHRAIVSARGFAFVAEDTALDARLQAINGATGETLWHATISDATRVRTAQLIPSEDGRSLAFVGTISGSTRMVGALLDTASGEILWQTTWDGPGSADTASGGALTNEALVIAGTSSQQYAHFHCFGCSIHYHSHTDLSVVALDLATGAPVWSRSFARGPDYQETLGAIVPSPDGTSALVLVNSREFSGFFPPSSAFLLKHNGANPALEWTTTLPETGRATGNAIAVSPATGLAMALVGGNEGASVVAVQEATGAHAWTWRSPEGASSTGAGLVASADGARVLALTNALVEGGEVTALRALDAAQGFVAWESVTSEPLPNRYATSLIASADGTRVHFIEARSYSNATSDARLVTHNALDGSVESRLAVGPESGGPGAVVRGSGADLVVQAWTTNEAGMSRSWLGAYDGGIIRGASQQDV